MYLRQVVAVGTYITKCSNEKFNWGTNDCNTFVAGAIDRVLGTARCERQIQGQYNDEKSAIRFQKAYVPAEKYLKEMGWEKVEKSDIQDFDVLLADMGPYRAAHFVFGGKIWSCHREFGVVETNSVNDMTHDYDQWRKK